MCRTIMSSTRFILRCGAKVLECVLSGIVLALIWSFWHSLALEVAKKLNEPEKVYVIEYYRY